MNRIADAQFALGGSIIVYSLAFVVSWEWAAIQSTASSLEVNFPKWCTAPFGHTICTRQILPSQNCAPRPHLTKYARLDETDKPSDQARPSSVSKANAVDPTPSLLSFGETIALIRERLNVSSERAAAVVRDRLSRANSISSEMTTSIRSAARNLRSSKRIFSTGLIARWPRRKLRASQIASGQGRLRLNCGAQLGRLTIFRICRSVVTWPNG